MLAQQGYQLLENVYTRSELKKLQSLLAQSTPQAPNFRMGKDLFAIRHVTEVIPDLMAYIWNDPLKAIFNDFGKDYRLVKSLYFDKPPQSNWFVFWHQDLTISVKEHIPINGFQNWTNKNGILGVQPPTPFLEDTITCRIHLDDCNIENGGLKVLPQSHLQGVLNAQQNQTFQSENSSVNCQINAGGVLLMKPLLLHASAKNSSEFHRRVLHLEFSSMKLPHGLEYREEVLPLS